MPKTVHLLLGDRTWLEQQIQAGRSQKEIADAAGTNASLVAYYVRKHRLLTGLERSERMKAALKKKYPNGRRGPLAANWHGGRMSSRGKKSDGYIKIYMPDHPAASRGYVYEHRYVMEQKLGRLLKPGEVVDHIDRNRENNHPDNLRLHESRSQHVKDHFSARDKMVLAHAIIRRYLDNHCANADAEGMSALCECKLCLDARQLLVA